MTKVNFDRTSRVVFSRPDFLNLFAWIAEKIMNKKPTYFGIDSGFDAQNMFAVAKQLVSWKHPYCKCASTLR